MGTENHKGWAEQQNWCLIEKIFSDAEGKEYTISINDTKFAINDFYSFKKDFIELIAKHRV